MQKPKRKKIHKKWAMYDWANSVYSLIITSTFLPEYYVSVTSNPATNDHIKFLGYLIPNTSLYSYALGFSFLIIALISPLLSAISDLKKDRKYFLFFFLILGSISSGMFFFFDADTLYIGVSMIILSCIGYWGSLVFYNAYLPEIATHKEVDAVSALGYKYGYIGSFILQVSCLVLVFFHEIFGIENQTIATRYSFLLVGFWWLLFGLYSIRGLPKTEKNRNSLSFVQTLKVSYKDLLKVSTEAFKVILIRRFLLSYLFFNMGIQIVMLVATIYGAKELAIPTTYLIITIIIIQLLAIVGADASAYLSKKIGNFLTLFILSIMWIGMCILAYFLAVGDVIAFFFIGAYVGLLMGGSQSLNRSTYAKIIPKTIFNTVYFSFYDVVEKISIVIGMFLFAYMEQITGSMRNSILVIIVFFIIGAYFLFHTWKRSKQNNIQYL